VRDFGEVEGEDVAVPGREAWSIARSTAGRYNGDLGWCSCRHGVGMGGKLFTLLGEVRGEVATDGGRELLVLSGRESGWAYMVGGEGARLRSML
jgi:hypothetical protein